MKQPKIVITVSGGVVQGVLCSIDAEVIVLDFDDAEHDGTTDAMEKEQTSHAETLKTIY